MKMLVWLSLCCTSACTPTPERPAESSREITGTQAERVASVSQLLSGTSALPSPLADAHFLERQIGDGEFGPSDYVWFGVLTVAPADLAAWRSALQPLAIVPEYTTPKQRTPWWLSRNDFLRLEFYDPMSLTGRSNGWIGIAPDGRVFVHAFTM